MTPPGPEGRLMISFRPHDWALLSEVACRPLLSMPGDADAGVPPSPFEVLVHDLPTQTASIPASEIPDGQFGRWRDEAVRNLATVDLEWQALPLPGTLLASSGFYTSEKVLDADLMRALQERLGAELLLAGIPERGTLLVHGVGAGTFEDQLMFLGLCQRGYDDAEPERRLSPAPLLISGGEIQGWAVSRPAD